MAGNVQQLKNDHPLEVPSLLDLSARIVANLLIFGGPTALIHQQICNIGKKQQQSGDQGLLPVRASEKVLQKLYEKWNKMQERGGRDINPEKLDAALAPFYNGQLFPVANVEISNVQITDWILAAFLAGQRESLTSLSLINTKGISAALLCYLLHESKIKLMHLRSLKLNSLDILRIPRVHGGRYYPPQFVHFCPNLEHLYLLQDNHAYNFDGIDETKSAFLDRIFFQLPNLRTLDLSGWILNNLSPLQSLQSLTTLVLYDVPDLEPCIFIISALKTLRHLDISQSAIAHGQYVQPVSSLHKIVCSLRKLQSLDISGTNLTAATSDNDDPFTGTIAKIDSDIPGLRSLEHPLKYLGIFNCEGTNADWENIPAEKISSEHNEDQVLTALEMYLERPRILQEVLFESAELYQDGSNVHRHVDALHLVLRALQMHLGNERVQIAGIDSISYLIEDVAMNPNTERRVIQALIDGMENHLDSHAMMHLFCATLCQLEELSHVKTDFWFAYDRVAKLLANVLMEMHNLDAITQQRVIWLLESMVRILIVKMKVEMGEAGVIEIMLKQIARKLQANVCDDLMEEGWSFLLHATNETPVNCMRFLKAQGLALFNGCHAIFADQSQKLLRNMLGVMLNISEMSEFRGQLMTNGKLELFCKLLDNLDEGIRVSYLSAGVLANLVSDEQCWAKSGVTLSSEHINVLIVQATEQWDLQTSFPYTCKSIKAILRLLTQWHAAGSQHWAVWALANKTTSAGDAFKKKVYCRFVFTEQEGVKYVEQLKTDPRSTDQIRQLADIVLTNVEDWKNSSDGYEWMANSADAGN